MKKSRIVENLFFTLGLFGIALVLIYLILGHEIFEKFLLLLLSQPIIFNILVGFIIISVTGSVVMVLIGVFYLSIIICMAIDFAPLRTLMGLIVFFLIVSILHETYDEFIINFIGVVFMFLMAIGLFGSIHLIFNHKEVWEEEWDEWEKECKK